MNTSPRRRPTTRLGTPALLIALALAPHVATAGEPRCPDISGEAMEGESKVATAVGLAVMVPGNPDLGIAPTTACFARLLTENDEKAGQLAMGLLMMMTTDPQRFFATLETQSPATVKSWLQDSLPYASAEFLGTCSRPDRFEQARKAITGLTLPTLRQRQLRDQVATALANLHCQNPG